MKVTKAGDKTVDIERPDLSVERLSCTGVVLAPKTKTVNEAINILKPIQLDLQYAACVVANQPDVVKRPQRIPKPSPNPTEADSVRTTLDETTKQDDCQAVHKHKPKSKTMKHFFQR